MNVLIEMEDGREISSMGRHRYHALRLTHNGGYKSHGDDNAKKAVLFAKDVHERMGFEMVVVDTVTCQSIAVYPKDLKVRVHY